MIISKMKCFLGRMMITRCALDCSRLSGTFDVYGITVGGILPYLGLGKGRKSCKIAEISTSLTPLQMADFFNIFWEKASGSRETHLKVLSCY